MSRSFASVDSGFRRRPGALQLPAMTRPAAVLFTSILAIASAGAPSHSPVGTWAWPAAGYSCRDPWVSLTESDVTFLGNGLWNVHAIPLRQDKSHTAKPGFVMFSHIDSGRALLITSPDMHVYEIKRC